MEKSEFVARIEKVIKELRSEAEDAREDATSGEGSDTMSPHDYDYGRASGLDSAVSSLKIEFAALLNPEQAE